MKVLLLGDEKGIYKTLQEYLYSTSEEVVVRVDKISLEELEAINPEIIVSYNYAYILKPEIFEYPKFGTINLHISFLSWNRGADPNFWSFIENTPKGVTIHYIDKGIDTGDIIVQKKVVFEKDATLKTSYDKLQEEIQNLFKENWEDIKSGKCERRKQKGSGSFHKKKDKEPLLYLLIKKWDTPVVVLEKYAADKTHFLDKAED